MSDSLSGQDVHISRAAVDDLPMILAIQKKAYLAEAVIYDDYAIPPLMESDDELRQSFERDVILKAEIGQILAGSIRVRLRGKVAEVGRLSVEPAFQKRGVGSALLLACDNVFPSADCCELFTGSRSMANIRLYEKFGYRVFQQRILSPQVTLVCFRKR